MLLRRHIERLADAAAWTYGASPHSAAEPAAWATLALLAYGKTAAARRPAAWLAERQQPGGAVGISATQDEPRWPTSLAMLAWSAWDQVSQAQRFAESIDRAARWSLADHGQCSPRSPMIGHDTSLIGWSWAAQTHSWMEPTCFFVLGLSAAGYAGHQRTEEGRRLVLDRLLPDGGANYGNTIVLGQPLLPHIQPSGLAMWALAPSAGSDLRIERTLEYLEREVGPQCAPSSLSFACLGLTAHGRRPQESERWCAAALQNATGPPLAVYEQSLLLLAARPDLAWMPAVTPASELRAPQPDLVLVR